MVLRVEVRQSLWEVERGGCWGRGERFAAYVISLENGSRGLERTVDGDGGAR